jgi:hypothetical protein
MVLVERPVPVSNVVEANEVEVDPTPSPNSLQANPPQQDDLNTNIKFFPNTLTSITDSGLLNVNKPVEITLNNLNPLQKLPDSPPATDSPEPQGNITETEIRRRTIMLSILFVLFVILVFATILLFVQKKPADNEPVTDLSDPKIKTIENNGQVDQPSAHEFESKPASPIADSTPPPTAPAINVTKNNDPPQDKNKSESEDEYVIFLPPPDEKKTTAAIADPNNPSAANTTDSLENPQETNEPNSIDKFWKDIKNNKKNQQSVAARNVEVGKRVDVSARLRQPIVGFRYEKVPLVKVIRVISDLLDVPVSFDVDVMRAFGIGVDAEVTGKFDAGNIGAILEKILTPLNLTVVIENDQLTVTVLSAKSAELSEETIDVSDIVKGTAGGDQWTMDRLVDVIVRFIDPVGFGNAAVVGAGEGGGENIRNDNKIVPAIRVAGESIFISSTRCRIDGVIRLLEQIRLLRGLPQRTKIVEDNLAPEVFGWDNMDVLITLNYYRETPLSVIFGQIEKMCGILIIVDHKNLHRANLSFNQLRGKLRANNITLNDALEQLCTSIDDVPITYRIVGGNIIELTTTHIARQPDKMSVEIHRYKITENKSSGINVTKNIADKNTDKIDSEVENKVAGKVDGKIEGKVEGNETPEQVVESIIAVINPASWGKITKSNNTNNNNTSNQNNVGETDIGVVKMPSDVGDIVIDRYSSCLIIRQTQPTQRQIRTWFRQQK